MVVAGKVGRIWTLAHVPATIGRLTRKRRPYPSPFAHHRICHGPKKVLIKVLEDEEEKHQKHEPLVCVLQHYDTVSPINPAFDALLTPSTNSSALSSSSRHSPLRNSTSYPHSSSSHLLLNPVPPHSPPSTLAGYSPASFSLTINSTAIIWRLFAI